MSRKWRSDTARLANGSALSYYVCDVPSQHGIDTTYVGRHSFTMKIFLFSVCGLRIKLSYLSETQLTFWVRSRSGSSRLISDYHQALQAWSRTAWTYLTLGRLENVQLVISQESTTSISHIPLAQRELPHLISRQILHSDVKSMRRQNVRSFAQSPTQSYSKR